MFITDVFSKLPFEEFLSRWPVFENNEANQNTIFYLVHHLVKHNNTRNLLEVARPPPSNIFIFRLLLLLLLLLFLLMCVFFWVATPNFKNGHVLKPSKKK